MVEQIQPLTRVSLYWAKPSALSISESYTYMDKSCWKWGPPPPLHNFLCSLYLHFYFGSCLWLAMCKSTVNATFSLSRRKEHTFWSVTASSVSPAEFSQWEMCFMYYSLWTCYLFCWLFHLCCVSWLVRRNWTVLWLCFMVCKLKSGDQS